MKRLKLMVSAPLFVSVWAGSAQAAQTQLCSNAMMSVLKSDARNQNDSEWNEDNFSSVACKRLPGEPDIMLGSNFQRRFMDPLDDSSQYLWRVVLVDTTTHQVVSAYTGSVGDEGGIRIDSDQIWLDTARYYLNDETRAFGVRLDIGHASRYAEGGASGYMTLFVREQEKLQPVLKSLPMNYWTNQEGHFSVTDEPVPIHQAKVYINIGNKISHGYRDLKLTTKVKDKMSDQYFSDVYEKAWSFEQTLKFDGKAYQGFKEWP
ncbi:hypothetical protein [Photobacterium sp. TLY01]|uniref:hypothetical protein n=1 Tax=Photobacterium sp. TLY01 TaxID=2907534 RepID=UPI001F470BC7|nr:hypothetical protein [Photobacterium sp. TLY01]UIP30236.1 hypothetical protein LN341_16025 [Photobacterium sp. TLY01]